MKNKILALIFLWIVCGNAFAAWNPDVPAADDYIYNWPTQVQANWDAIALGTDSALQITNAKVATSAAIADTKLATISTAGKVSGAALTSLSSVPSGAGALPLANGGSGQTTRQASIDALVDATAGSSSGKALITNGTNASWGYPTSLTVTSATTGDLLYYNGTTWTRLAPGTSGYSLQSAGASAAPVYSQVSLSGTEVTGTLPIANGGTGQTTAQTAIDALLPSQTANSGKFLTTNGTTSSWGIASAGLNLVSTTSWSNTACGSSCTKSIAIEDTKRYLVIWNIYGGTGTSCPTCRLDYIRFNNDSTAGAHEYYLDNIFGGTDNDGTGGSKNSILIQNVNTGTSSGYFYILPNKNHVAKTWITELVTGEALGTEYVSCSAGSTTGVDGLSVFKNYGSFTSDSTAITSLYFSFDCGSGDSMTGEILLYEITQ